MHNVKFKKNHVCSTTRVVYTAGKKYDVSDEQLEEMVEEGVLEDTNLKMKSKTRRSRNGKK